MNTERNKVFEWWNALSKGAQLSYTNYYFPGTNLKSLSNRQKERMYKSEILEEMNTETNKPLTVEEAANEFEQWYLKADDLLTDSEKFKAGAEWREKEGTIKYFEIAKDGTPPKTPGDDYTGNLILYNINLDQFCRGCYIHSINEWRHGTGNWQPTHWAYINYPNS